MTDHPDSEALGDALHALADCVQGALANAALWENAKSAYAADRQSIVLEAPNWPVGVIERMTFDSSRFVSLICRHVHSVAALVHQREMYVSAWPILRAQLEAAGRLTWILEPHDSGVGLTAKRRAARFFMEQLASACYHREALKGLKSKYASEAKAVRVHRANEIEWLFDTSLTWSGVGSESSWKIGDDSYKSIAAGAQLFATHLLPDLGGVYGSLSGYSHPSLRFLEDLLVESADGDMRRLNWVSSDELTSKQCLYSATIAYRAATMFCSYVGGPQDQLETAFDAWELVGAIQ